MEVSGRPAFGLGRDPAERLPRYRVGARVAAGLGFFMAIAFGVSALVTALQAKLSGAAAICAVVLCSETLLILLPTAGVRTTVDMDYLAGDLTCSR